MKLDVSIVLYGNSVSEIHATVSSLLNSFVQSKFVEINVDLMDNKCEFNLDEFFSHLEETNPEVGLDNCRINYFGLEKNLGYGAANNKSIFGGNGDFHLILNPDVILSQDTLSLGLDYILDNNCVMLSPKIYENELQVVSGIKRYPSVLVLLLRFLNVGCLNDFFIKYLENYSYSDVVASNYITNVEIASGCFMFVDKKVLLESEGFDERFFLYFEDFDLSMRLNKFGQIVYLPEMKVQHSGGHTGRKGMKHIRFFISSMIKFFSKYHWKFM